jgi:hypothetical protein
VPLIWQNQKTLFALLFETSAATLLEVAADPKHLGAEIGFALRWLGPGDHRPSSPVLLPDHHSKPIIRGLRGDRASGFLLTL